MKRGLLRCARNDRRVAHDDIKVARKGRRGGEGRGEKAGEKRSVVLHMNICMPAATVYLRLLVIRNRKRMTVFLEIRDIGC